MKNFEKGSAEIILFVLLIVVLIAGVMGNKINLGGLLEEESEEIQTEETATTSETELNNQ